MKNFSKQIRIELINMLLKRGFGHLGGSMSIVETLSVLYSGVMKIDPSNPSWEERDYLVLSKGHAGPALYSTLALKGYFDISLLQTLNDNGTSLPSHCDRILTPGIDMTTGSLGQGISAAVGIAMGIKIEDKQNRVYAIIGDGEMNEGQCYEAFQFSVHNHLDNLIVFVDENKIQLDGFTKDIINPLDLEAKIKAFGFNTVRVDGHDEEAILNAINNAKNVKGVPSCIVLDTIKGKGAEGFENLVSNHHVRFSNDQNVILHKAVAKLEEELS